MMKERKQIVEDLRYGKLKLKDLLKYNKDEVPEHLLFHFACDCYEKIIMEDVSLYPIRKEDFDNAFKVSRDFIEGKVSKEEYESAWDIVSPIALAEARRPVSDLAWVSVAIATPRQRWWQTQHMADLLEEYLYWQERLLNVLEQMKLKMLGWIYWKQELEEIFYGEDK